MKSAPHIPLTRRQFVRSKRKQLRALLRQFYGDDAALMSGMLLASPEACVDLIAARRLMKRALETLNQVRA